MQRSAIKRKINIVIFGTDTPLGKAFDICLIYMIALSVLVVILGSVSSIEASWGNWIIGLEWFFTIMFTLEYFLRIYATPKRWTYIFSFYGLVDLLSVLPMYLSLFFTGANYLIIIRILRVLRIFRVLKLVRYLSEANILVRSMMMSRRKILIFFSSVLVLAVVFGSLMFVVEGPEHGFNNIPKSIYWTIVTITTVGYGDITPQTVLGQIIASVAMLTGYSIIAVPTGILTAELATEIQRERHQLSCKVCSKVGHESDSKYCRNCGAVL